VLFNDTLAYNIGFGRPGASAAEIEGAARSAELHDFIAALPEGYDTLVGDGGRPLSTGERRRLALARAFLRDAPLLLLDEPTAHLDADTAARLDAALATLAAGRTVIRVSHDQRQAAGRVFVLDRGRLTQAPAQLAVAS
jgi:ABC-type multidrug transport system fused ATPase/permease subunit